MEYIVLNNGIKMPILGFGTFQISKEETKKAVLEALKIGYRLIDTAQCYYNEEEVGEALSECNIKREELFVTTKVWIDNYSYDKCKESVLTSLKKLKLDYLDLVLIHHPYGDVFSGYRALEDLYLEGKIKAIGISNFYPDRMIDLNFFSKIKPMVNQVEINPFYQQEDAKKWNDKYLCKVQAWAPFCEGKKDIFQNETLNKIAMKYNKSVAQIILRWLVERNIPVVCKSIQEERMKENFDIFDFSLSSDDMKIISSLDKNTSSFYSYTDPNRVEWFTSLVEKRRNIK